MSRVVSIGTLPNLHDCPRKALLGRAKRESDVDSCAQNTEVAVENNTTSSRGELAYKDYAASIIQRVKVRDPHHEVPYPSR